MSVLRGFALHATRRSAPEAPAGAKGARGESTSYPARGPMRDRMGSSAKRVLSAADSEVHE